MSQQSRSLCWADICLLQTDGVGVTRYLDLDDSEVSLHSLLIKLEGPTPSPTATIFITIPVGSPLSRVPLPWLGFCIITRSKWNKVNASSTDDN